MYLHFFCKCGGSEVGGWTLPSRTTHFLSLSSLIILIILTLLSITIKLFLLANVLMMSSPSSLYLLISTALCCDVGDGFLHLHPPSASQQLHPTSFVASTRSFGRRAILAADKRTRLHFFDRGGSDDTEGSIDDNDDEGERRSLIPNIIDLKGSSSFAKYGRPQDIDGSTFGPLLPIAEAVDDVTGGWGLSYADLHPATPRTTVGRAFLATNFFYAFSGLWLGINGDWFYGGLTELAGVVSFVYHYTQLEFGKNRSEVRLALLIDYFCAGSALLTGGAYMIQAGITSVPLDAVISAAVAAVCLSLCWVWEFGYPYIFWHSLWHIASAYTGYLVGQEHLNNIAGG